MTTDRQSDTKGTKNKSMDYNFHLNTATLTQSKNLKHLECIVAMS